MNDSPAQRGADWLISQMNPDGSLRGGKSINEYYKSVYGLAVAGRNRHAEQMLEYIVKRFVKDDGDLDGTGCAWFEQFRIYPHAWVIMAALLRGRLDIVRRVSQFVETFHDADSGGCYHTIAHRDARGEQEMMTTGLLGIALLWAGRIDVALRVARWMRHLYEAQPDLSRGLYFVRNHRGELVTDFRADDAKSYFVDATKPSQRYYNYGIPAALLSALAGATGEAGWLELARKYLAASAHCQDDVYRQPQAGKIGWGAAWTFRTSGAEADARLARTVAQNLAALQNPDGSFSGINIYQRDMRLTPQPSLDVTGEFVGHLAWIETLVRNEQ